MQFKKKLIPALVLSVVVSGGLAGSGYVYADDTSDELAKLRAEIDELDQKIKVLDRKNEIADEEAAAKKKDNAVVKASADGFGIQSADGNFTLNIKGQFQANERSYLNGISSGTTAATQANTPDTFFLRQVRPIFSGTLFHDYEYLFVPDFGQGKTVIQDAYLNANWQPWFQVEAGKQKTPFGLERLQADADGLFIERGLPNDLVPNRDIGAQIHGNLASNTFTYAVGYFNGVADGSSSDSYTTPDSDNNDNKSYVARIFATPFKNEPGILQGLGLGFAVDFADFNGNGAGAAGAAQTISQSNLPTYKSALGQLSIFSYRTAAAAATNGTYANGDQLRWSPQAYYYYGPFGVIGEYVQVDQDVSRALPAGFSHSATISNDAWQIAGSVFLTGEDAGYARPTPKSNFSFSGGGWGAWELVARYSQLDIDSKAFSPFGTGTAAVQQGRSFADPTAAIRKAGAWAIGTNWYPNKNVKVYVDYEQTDYTGGFTNAAGTTVLDRPTERVLETQVQLAF